MKNRKVNIKEKIKKEIVYYKKKIKVKIIKIQNTVL